VSWLIVGTIVGAMILWRVFVKLWPRNQSWAGILAGAIVIASSTYSLFNEPPQSLAFRVHVALIIAMVVVIGFHARKIWQGNTVVVR
jgi:hypothetical protein